MRSELIKTIESNTLTETQATWSLWALGHIAKDRNANHAEILRIALESGDLNLRIQATRVLGENKVIKAVPVLIKLLTDDESRIRTAAMQSLDRIGWGGHRDAIVDAIAPESERIAFYTDWQVMRRQLPENERREMLTDERQGIRRMAALGLMEEGDQDLQRRALSFLEGSDAGFGAGLTIRASQRNFRDSTKVIFETKTPFQIRFTSDGSNPTNTSFKAPKEITVSDEMTIKAAIFDGKRRVSEIESITVHKISESEWKDRLFVEGIGGKGSAKSYRANLDSLQRGVTVYADRKYTFTEIPDALAGATHLRTHNDDKANLDAQFLRFQTNLPAVLYLAYDGRTAPPKALTAGMEKTDMILKISNGESFPVYRRMVEAGEVVLAGNKAGGSGGESMYQVFLTKEGAGKTTISEVKGALAKVDLKHGEEIFFGRGTCFACHKVGDRGVAIGPDLVGIGKRRDMDYVIQSTLEPDAYIVEGFQQTSLEMKDGRVLFGMIGEETALSLKLVLLTGEQIVVRPDEIKKRSDAKNSIMPASFSNTLSAQDVADISAWIMSLK